MDTLTKAPEVGSRWRTLSGDVVRVLASEDWGVVFETEDNEKSRYIRDVDHFLHRYRPEPDPVAISRVDIDGHRLIVHYDDGKSTTLDAPLYIE